MAIKVPHFDWDAPRPNNTHKYPWNEWFNGETWRVTLGVDFDQPVNNFRSAILKAARIRNIVVRTTVRGNDVVFKAEL